MTAPSSDPVLSPTKRALLEIRELRARVADLEASASEPVAIVGMSIRAPGGVRDVAGFAELLWNGVDAIGPIPADRWKLDDWYDADPDVPAKMTTRFGGFIDQVDRFDAEFFGISPREAASMDPQQRLVLELAWQALEDAGQSPAALAGSQTGVYLGIANDDYGRAIFAHPELIDPYFSPGNAYSVASGRLAYVLGLHGPAISVDTACSSSLVALHLACQGLRAGECTLALAGGVNLILSPEVNVNFSKAGMMAPDGRCKTFDASADGYVRGEGGAMVVLRRLRDAVAHGDRILAVIRGSAVNQDGRSNGLTAPNGPAQEAVLKAALGAAGVLPAQVGYVEAHGTGTSLGDPIEVNAIGSVMAAGRDRNSPLVIGSVKTNVGHLEAAAGIAGVVKAVLVLNREEIPPSLHFEKPNPFIDWPALPVRVATGVTPFPSIDGRRLAGVSAFGFSGTNAHVVLESAPVPGAPDRAGTGRPTQVLALSARDSEALREVVASYRGVLAQIDDDRIADVCFTANVGRAHFTHRLAVQAGNRLAADEALAAWERRESHPALVTGRAAAAAPRVAFLFPGQGPQYLNMGRDLYETAPAFREAFDRCAEVLDALLPEPIRPVIFAPPGTKTPLDETVFSQPAMFAIEVSLAALWRSWGIAPVAVMGHSFGEYAAACVAGAMSLPDAARMVTARGRLAQALPRDGAMTVVEASEADVLAAIAADSGRIAIAAVNGPTNTVISGERAVVDAVAASFAAKGARVKPLRVSHAFHSPLIDSVLDAFELEVSTVRFSEPRIALVSNLSGRLADLALIGRAGYWRDHMRQPVRFADSIRALAAQGITHYIEMSPHPVLLSMGSDAVSGGEWLPSLREGKDAWTVILESLQLLYCGGAEVDWEGFDRGQGRRRLSLPTYPFQRKRHWVDVPAVVSPGDSAAGRWKRVTDGLDRQAERGPLDLNVSSYPAKWAILGRLTTAHAIETLRGAGLFQSAGERRTLDEVMRVAGFGATYAHLVERWLEGLVARGLLRRVEGKYLGDAPLPDAGLPGLWAEAELAFADNRPLFDYVRHCGTLVADVLRGRESPLETLFPGGSFDLAQGLYERSATMLYINQLAAAAIEVLGASTPAGRRLRVLEVGAGTGGTTSALLRVLSPERRIYRFTDVSDAFLDRARERFAGQGGLEYGRFDLDAEAEGQGYSPRSFDVIVSANAVHAVMNLPAALRRLHDLLAPGGMLVLVESTVHLDYFDMTTGLIEGWQHFADDVRGDNPLLAPSQWAAALTAAGFEEVRAWPGAGSPAEALGQHVIVARVAGESAGGAAVLEPAAGAEQALGSSQVESPAEDLWLDRLGTAMASERIELLRDLVREQVMAVLRLDPTAPPARHDRLMDLGMDSLMAVQLRNRLSRALRLERALPSTLMFDYPTIDGIAGFLLLRLVPAQAAAEPEAGRPVTVAAMSADAVAAMSDEEIARLLDERLGSP